MNRKLGLVYTPQEHQGFLGQGHIARYVIGGDFTQSDPFIMLADDVLDKKNTEPVGGPHPHAGFETVTFVLEGEIGAGDHIMRAGDFQMMTAGSGIVHTETIDKKLKMRILQLWLTLPEQHRWATPRVQDLSAAHVPGMSQDGLNIKVYSGRFAGISSPILNYVRLILADINLKPGVTLREAIPGSFNTFMYVIDGAVKVGDEAQWLQQNEVGWLDPSTDSSQSYLHLSAGDSGARVVLYSAEPQGSPIVSHGPFIGNTEEDIQRLYREYRQGKMEHVSRLAEEHVYAW